MNIFNAVTQKQNVISELMANKLNAGQLSKVGLSVSSLLSPGTELEVAKKPQQ